MTAYQYKLEGGMMVSTGNAIRDQLAEIMETYPESRNDEDLLAAYWLLDHGEVPFECYAADRDRLCETIRKYRRADIPRRRRELAEMGLYPWSPEEAERRQKRAKGGPPGG
jgi:hypothetical protein